MPGIEIEVEWADRLPGVNVGDTFLVTNMARECFCTDLQEFFPSYMQDYFWPRILSRPRNNEEYIQVFSPYCGNQKRSRFVPISAIRKTPEGIDSQIEAAKNYFVSVNSFAELSSKLTVDGQRMYGLREPFLGLASIEDFLRLLHSRADEKTLMPVLRFFAGYLFKLRRFLWPLNAVIGEPKWSFFVAHYGYYFGEWITKEFRIGEASVAFRLLRTTTWDSWTDIRDEDITAIWHKLRNTRKVIRIQYSTVLNKVTSAAIRNGNPLTYVPVRARVSKAKSRGGHDGSFTNLDDAITDKEASLYWKSCAKKFYQYEHTNGRQDMVGFCRDLNKWFGYLSFLDERGLCPKSLTAVSRDVHIACYSDSNNPVFPTFQNWLLNVKKYSLDTRYRSLSCAKQFFFWIKANDSLNIKVPISDLDIVRRNEPVGQSYRPAFSVDQWWGLREMLLERPPRYLEVTCYDENKNAVWEESPILSTYALIRLELGIRDGQARFLDKDKMLGTDGIVISGDKNINRKHPQVIPYFDPELKLKIEQTVEWQNTKNHPAEPIWYEDHKNSPFGKVHPLLRRIGRDGHPISKSLTRSYMIRVLLKYQKEQKLKGKDQIVWGPDGLPIEDMERIDPDTLGHREANTYKTLFDLHSFRVGAATCWYEAGVPLEVIMRFITGHAALTMLLHYIKIRNAKKILEAAFARMAKQSAEIKSGLREGQIDETVQKFLLSSRRSGTRGSDGVAALKGTSSHFWRFFHYGICPGCGCPDGLDGRCALCPLLISGPSFKPGIAAQFNMTVSRALEIGLEIRNCKVPGSNREAQLQSLVQEMAGWLGWLNAIEQMQTEDDGGKIVLYAQEYDPAVNETSPVIHELQRCVDIRYCPPVWTENTFQKARAFLLTFLSRLPDNPDPGSIISRLTPQSVCRQVAGLFMGLVEAGKNYAEIETIFTNGKGEIDGTVIGRLAKANLLAS